MSFAQDLPPSPSLPSIPERGASYLELAEGLSGCTAGTDLVRLIGDQSLTRCRLSIAQGPTGCLAGWLAGYLVNLPSSAQVHFPVPSARLQAPPRGTVK